MLSRASSQICGRWYLPTFLFRDGLFTLMYRASFMSLVRSPQDGKNVNSDRMTRDVDMVMYRGWGLEMFLKPLFKISSWLCYVFMITTHPATFISVYDPMSFKDWIFILRGHEKVFDGMTSLQMYFNPIFSASSLEALTQPLMVRNHNMCFWPSDVVWSWLLAVLMVFLWADAWLFIFTLFSAQFEYFNWVEKPWRDWGSNDIKLIKGCV